MGWLNHQLEKGVSIFSEFLARSPYLKFQQEEFQCHEAVFWSLHVKKQILFWERKKTARREISHVSKICWVETRDPCKDDPIWYMLPNGWTNPTMTRPNARDAGNMIWQIPSVPSSDVLTWTARGKRYETWMAEKLGGEYFGSCLGGFESCDEWLSSKWVSLRPSRMSSW